MKPTIILLLLVLGLQKNLSAQACPSYPVPPKQGPLSAYIPKGWQLMDSTGGDFNSDGLRDLVLVLEISQAEEWMLQCHRPLIILQGLSANQYRLSAYSREAVLCQQCGGVFGDPYEHIELKKNVLNINHYGGSAWRWTKNFTFRFQNKQWELIGLSEMNYWTNGACEDVGSAALSLDEVNFSTARMHFIRTKNDACKPYRDEWKKFIKKQNITLSRFQVEKNYFPLKLNE